MKYGNCLLYAVLRRLSGGSIKMIPTQYGWVPRFIWESPEGVYEWFQAEPRTRWVDLPQWRRVLPVHVLFFKGVVKRSSTFPR